MNEPEVKTCARGNVIFVLACILVIGIFVWSAVPGSLEFEGSGPADAYYNLLVQGFHAGQLNVKREPAPGLARLSNPYDSAANRPYVWDEHYFSHDMSYYKGKLYLYFGITPALVLFWPYNMVTGHYLSHRNACVIFSVLGFMAAASVIYGIWQRYFPEASPWVMASAVMALGLAGGLLEILSASEVYEVAISCGFAFTMMALAAVWRVLHERERKIQWMALASFAYGLAIGSRPSLLFGSLFLLVPVAAASGETGRVSWRDGCLLFAAAVVPLMLVGLGLMLYNVLRFGSPFEFGWHYQLTGFQNYSARQFSLGYLWINFRFYFLEPMRWTVHFPFLETFVISPLPAGYAGIDKTSYGGILSNYPVAWMALAAPLAWKGRMERTAALRWFAAGVLALFAICAATLCLFFAASSRYEVDFLPLLLMLAVMGILGLERASAGLAPFWRMAARCIWCAPLAYSLLCNILVAIDAHAATRYFSGNFFFNHGRLGPAIEYFSKASALKPNDAGYHFSLGSALSQAGRRDESIGQFQRALEIEPNFPEADNNLAFTLLGAGDVDGAIKYFQKASELQKSYQTFYNLGCAYRMKKIALEAETNWQKAIELQPQFIPAQVDLSWMLATWPDPSVRDGARAVVVMKNLDRQVPNDPRILRTLAAADAETGQFSEATSTAKRAEALAQSESRVTLARQLQNEAALYQSNTPCRTFSN